MDDDRRRFTRKALTLRTTTMGVESLDCILCRQSISSHKDDCVFADASVTHIIVIKSRASIVFYFRQNRWWWQSPGGNRYHIEKLPAGPRYVMFDGAGNEIVARKRLSDIRQYLELNQGRY